MGVHCIGWEANCDSDYPLVKATYLCRIYSVHRSGISPTETFAADKLLSDATAQAYKAALEENLSPMLHDISNTDVRGFWGEHKGTIKEVAEKVVGYKSRRTQIDWLDDECGISLDAKDEPYRQCIQRATRAKKKYYELRRISISIFRRILTNSCWTLLKT